MVNEILERICFMNDGYEHVNYLKENLLKNLE